MIDWECWVISLLELIVIVYSDHGFPSFYISCFCKSGIIASWDLVRKKIIIILYFGVFYLKYTTEYYDLESNYYKASSHLEISNWASGLQIDYV